MMPLIFSNNTTRPLKVLCLGAHSDDIEIGCGGTLISLIEKFPDSEFLWVVFSASNHRKTEALNSARLYLEKIQHKEILIADFRDSFFPYIGKEIKEYMGALRQRMDPDVIFTTYRHDFHQDHRLISELTLNTFRNHLIYEFEILKYDGDLGTPNIYIALDKSICLQKIKRLNDCFNTQSDKQWFDDESFMALMRIRGVESNASTRYAEAFYCRKSVLSLKAD